MTYKPKLNVQQQIDHLAGKGIKFEIISKESATDYLSNNNNYFKLTAYRKSYAKYPDEAKINAGKYINLDFAYLQDLAIIDMRLRYLMLQMALDVEHYSKVSLLKIIENSNDDGYQIVKKYIDNLRNTDTSLGTNCLKTFENEINRNRGNDYCGAIIDKYDNNYPAWAFVEIIPFGRLVKFYKHCAEYFENEGLENNYYLLLSSKELRNASAHSNCIINDLSPSTAIYRTNFAVSRELMKLPGMKKDIRQRRMSNVRIQQIVTLLYTHKAIVTSEGVHNHIKVSLHEFEDRMFRNIDYYKDNEMITSTFNFLKIVVDNWFS